MRFPNGVRHMRLSMMILAGSVLVACVAPASAEWVAREQDIGDLRLGQKIQVDDGSCPAGQIKEILGSTLTAAGVTRVRKCVPRLGAKKR